MSYEFHDAANIFPMMSDEQIDELAADIEANGQKFPIELYDGKIIDGRNRYMAIMRLDDIEPDFYETDLEGQSAVSYTLSMNLHRRHLDESQKAMVAARAKPLFEAEAKERMKRKPSFGVENLPQQNGKARDKAGESVGVSGKSVDFASKVLTSGSAELQNAVERGEVAVSAAAKLAGLPKDKQTELVKEAEASSSTRKLLSDAAKKVTQIAASMDPWESGEHQRRDQVENGHAVVANSTNDSRLIAWADENGLSVYVGRGSDWGNPFIVDKDGDRDTVCDKYVWYLDRKPSLDCATLKGKVLVCYCHPARCHADELARRANGDT